MADPLSITASILAVAGAGAKLSTTLYTYAETVFNADKSLKEIARDVSLTSSVLNELGEYLKKDKEENISSTTALKTADDTVSGINGVFEEINAALNKYLKTKDGKSTVSALGRFKFPLGEGKIKLLQSNMERLKSTLMLMLQVLTYARKLESE
jgi:hypothetical protein